jgi:hypothetical protein
MSKINDATVIINESNPNFQCRNIVERCDTQLYMYIYDLGEKAWGEWINSNAVFKKKPHSYSENGQESSASAST